MLNDGFCNCSMGSLFSPGSWITVAGTSLAVFGLVAYGTDHPTLNLAGLFSGIPLLLGGLALKSSELPPVPWLHPPDARSKGLRQTVATEVQRRLVRDVQRWRYGQKAHINSPCASNWVPMRRARPGWTRGIVWPVSLAQVWRRPWWWLPPTGLMCNCSVAEQPRFRIRGPGEVAVSPPDRGSPLSS